MPTVYDPKFQEGPDGPLTEEVRDRLRRLRESDRRCTFAFIGEHVGMSGSFVSGVQAGRAIRSRHVPQMITKLEALERQFIDTPTMADGKRTVTVPAEDFERMAEHIASLLQLLPDPYRADALRHTG
jgi:Ni,Fe-hydrogenase III large subunit